MSSPSSPGRLNLAEFASMGADGSLVLWSADMYPDLVSQIWEHDELVGIPSGVAYCDQTGNVAIWTESAVVVISSTGEPLLRELSSVYFAQFVDGDLVVLTREGLLKRLFAGLWQVLSEFETVYCISAIGVALIFGLEGRVWRIKLSDGSVLAAGVIKNPPEKGFGWYHKICPSQDCSTFVFSEDTKLRLFDATSQIIELEPFEVSSSVVWLNLSPSGENLFVGAHEAYSIVNFPGGTLVHNHSRGFTRGTPRMGAFDCSNRFFFEHAYASSLNILSQENWEVVASIRMSVLSVAAQSPDGKSLFCILQDNSVVCVSLDPARWGEISRRIAGRDWTDAEKERYLSGA